MGDRLGTPDVVGIPYFYLVYSHAHHNKTRTLAPYPIPVVHPPSFLYWPPATGKQRCHNICRWSLAIIIHSYINCLHIFSFFLFFFLLLHSDTGRTLFMSHAQTNIGYKSMYQLQQNVTCLTQLPRMSQDTDY